VIISHGCIKRILRANHYGRRKPPKSLAIGESPDRKAQFEIIFFLIALFSDMAHNPIISIDTKKKEVLGQLTRNKAVLCKGGKSPKVFSHD
jgi:Rhodopirellula transposase DDE domain